MTGFRETAKNDKSNFSIIRLLLFTALLLLISLASQLHKLPLLLTYCHSCVSVEKTTPVQHRKILATAFTLAKLKFSVRMLLMKLEKNEISARVEPPVYCLKKIRLNSGIHRLWKKLQVIHLQC